ncbi:MAG: hypothetical protein KJ072_06605 [Verrucomicrobia bacterium]|nr:hypothetical protein [Verrucomicrobiota bacterium]
MRKLILKNGFSPGDIVMLTAAVRDLHRCHPGEFLTDVRTPCPDLWLYNPHLTALKEADPEVQVVECHYPLIDLANEAPYHCLHGFIAFLNEKLGLSIRPTVFGGDIHLSELEKSWHSQVREVTRRDLPFWIIDAGGKHDVTCKWWDAGRYQEVVDRFRGRIQFVQVGAWGDHHPGLNGVIDFRGQTTLRELVRLVYHAQGVLCPVTSLMHLAAAVPLKDGLAGARACVVVAGGREPAHWEAYPGHQFIHTNGVLPCCAAGGCWKDRVVPLGDGDPRDRPQSRCVDVVRGLPRCLDLIAAEDVAGRIELFFQGGMRRFLTAPERRAAARGVRSTRGNDYDQQPLSMSSVRLATDRAAGQLRRLEACSGRGIVICAGGPRYFTNAWVCIHRLRAVGCKLPIELWHLGKDELNATMRSMVEPLGVRCVDALRLRRSRPVRRLGGWELKAYALFHSAFAEVLLLDADNVSIRDPEYLFETASYRLTGALFWPDYEQRPKWAPLWHALGVRRPAEREFESGQILVDKRRCERALGLALWFNENSDFFYSHLHGDKETFHLAFRRLRQPYSLVSHPIRPLEFTMCQHDPAGNRIFQHRNGDKWNLPPTNRRVKGFKHEEECRRHIASLRRIWDGGVAEVALPRRRIRASSKELKVVPVMISCADREALRRRTLESFGRTDWASEAPWVQIDTELDEEDRRIRQTRNTLKALRRGLESGGDYILFLEDDLVFNRHLWHNLMCWRPLRQGCLALGGLYNPGLLESACSTADQAMLVKANRVFGSQALLLSRAATVQVVREWRRVRGMQDIRISRLAGKPGPVYYHSPSLVQHVGFRSLWGGPYHGAIDFDPVWKARRVKQPW